MEYASTIEFNESSDVSYLLDSELFRTRAKVYHDLSTRTFLLAEAELLGAYGGVLDGFLEWYHGLLGIEIPERERPTEESLPLRRRPRRGAPGTASRR